jgi:hypothetical protein
MLSLLCTICSVLAVPILNTTNISNYTNVSLRRTQSTNCCGGGAACGWVPCPGANVPCVRPWQMPTGLTWPNDCLQTAVVDLDGSCSSAPCLNSGSCSETSTSYACLCDSGYTGVNCDVATVHAVTVQPGLDPSPSGVAVGGRCAAGFCENANDCPQCAAGLNCVTATDQLCAGTCYGQCSPATAALPPALPGVSPIPPDCAVWFDGCNTCAVVNGVVSGCTQRLCFSAGTPSCTYHSH